MFKNQIRKKILKIREKNYTKGKISIEKIFNVIKKIKKNKKIIGCYFSVNFEVNTDRIIEFFNDTA